MEGTNARAEGEVVELLQQLIRNACVNDGRVDSGHEERSVSTLTDYLEGSGLQLERFESAPGRQSLVARIEGMRRDAPTLLLMGHTDVVPVHEEGWREDPFGGELIDGEVWGRGAVDMLNLTASMAVALKQLVREGFRPDGTLVFLAVADEEAHGTYGAGHLVAHDYDAVRADYVITESGGIPIPSPAGLKLPVIVGEKGLYWCRLRISGTPGHGSQPYRTDNALVKAAQVVQRLHDFRPETRIHDVWRRFIESMGYPEEITEPLLSADGFESLCESLPVGMARQFHACTHLTIAPTVVQGGDKINTIPHTVELDVDVRTLPGQTIEEARAALVEALGELASSVEIITLQAIESTSSPIDTPLWDSLSRVTQQWYPGSQTVPYLTVGSTDAKYFRGKGVTSYGFGLFSRKMTFEDYGAMFHGDNERVDVESLSLSTALWAQVARDLLG
ncbi:M20/M25/M40 family metallo-hydrolase [Rhabdothermincola sediminis]|uniref:M20/M25/M40 family metallo-hydrolase n=1 Tax=Rhabdothermincola sediminis TaxID=2751370 RepID=UPI001AA02AB9|nr:M20/M25/M40 family metallo-hydrolase [Rhabdothermincola sediminis]